MRHGLGNRGLTRGGKWSETTWGPFLQGGGQKNVGPPGRIIKLAGPLGCGTTNILAPGRREVLTHPPAQNWVGKLHNPRGVGELSRAQYKRG